MDKQTKDLYNQIMNSTEKQAYTLPSEFSMDSTVNLIAQDIFNVTAFHELVPQVTYTQYQSGVGLRLVDNATSTDLQSYLIGAVITALTAASTAKRMGEVENRFTTGWAPEHERVLRSK